jgi:polysaccharide biosynthesis protein PslH
MSNILFLSRWFPFPPNNGSKIRIYNLIRAIAKVHSVYLVAFRGQDEEIGSATEMLMSLCREVNSVPWAEQKSRGIAPWVSLLARQPRSVTRQHSPEMAELVSQITARQRFDVVIASQIDMAPYALKAQAPVRIFEEAEISGFVDRIRQAQPVAARVRAWLTGLKQTRYLAVTMRAFDGCTTVSEREKAELLEHTPRYSNLEVVPNGIDLSHYAGDFGSPQPHTLIYPGALTYSANLDAVRYFLEHIFPEILTQNERVQLTVTGSLQGVNVGSLPLRESTRYSGYLEDIRPAITQSWATIVPLRQGGGTRLKILESLALGTPVVATSKGAEGLELLPGRDLLIADTPDAFARAVLLLLNHPSLRETLRRNGRLALERYDWAKIGPRFVDFMERTGRMRTPEMGIRQKEVTL